MNYSNKSIGKNISILHRFSQAYIVRKLREYNIGSGQYPFLITLLKNDGISQEEVSHMLHIDKGTTARAIKKLEEQGYVYRIVDEEDKRVYKVYVTEKAQDVKKSLFKALEAWRDVLMKNFNEDEKKKTVQILEKMTENVILYTKEND
ncbi:MarR family transcriptional regulator [Clostridium aestuarii]|uniref:MarR family transcriptional regulator n=1 Tax=Clostridium aestuarii TaxID=338193 RepID=A0ABT4D494_9CLOT|nr:MarR family transcriptional regulator [Clostridium aestuarii]MCY6485020.1 MarR family transcriptional regulator [Clostridium aestuarii]